MAPAASDGLVLKIGGVKIKLLIEQTPHIFVSFVGTTPYLVFGKN